MSSSSLSLGRADRSVSSHQSGTSSSLSISSRRFVIEEEKQQAHTGTYLPDTLFRNTRLSNFDCDRSLQELDEAVASVGRNRSSKSFDAGETSPTSVSHGASADPIEQRVIRHLTQTISYDVSQVGSYNSTGRSSQSVRSVRSSRSRNSRSSRSTRSSRSRKRGGETLEQTIYRTILGTADDREKQDRSMMASPDGGSLSAQFILTDLFNVATNTMKENALPDPPFGDGTLWSELIEDNEKSAYSKADPGGAKVSLLPPMLPGTSNGELDLSSLGVTEEVKLPPRDDLFDGIDGLAVKTFSQSKTLTSLQEERSIDVIKEEDTESGSFHAFEQAAFEPSIKHNTTIGTGTLDLSLDDSMLQYSTTYGSSAFSEHGPSVKTISKQDDRTSAEAAVDDDWTNFDCSAFKETIATEDGEALDDPAFGSLLPFQEEFDETTTKTPDQSTDMPEFDNIEAIESAFDKCKISSKSSPSSPASVFNFFANDDVMDSDHSDIRWEMPASAFSAGFTSDFTTMASF